MDVESVNIKVTNQEKIEVKFWMLTQASSNEQDKKYQLEHADMVLPYVGGKQWHLVFLEKIPKISLSRPKYVPGATQVMPRPSAYFWFRWVIKEYYVK